MKKATLGKRFLAVFLCFVMCFSMLPVSAFAEGPEGFDETPIEEEEPEESQGPGLLDTFTYTVNGSTYSFPTRMGDVDPADLPVEMDQVIEYVIHEDQVEEGIFNELSNTAYFFTDGTLMGEMCGVSNIRGTDVPVSDGVLTHLTDLRGGMLLELPGGLKVGAPEEAVFEAFPPFKEVKMDGVAGFIGNEFVYGCNVRSDGTNGYLLIRNDRPYYSTVSVICEDGVVREISFECIGSNRAKGVFLPD